MGAWCGGQWLALTSHLEKRGQALQAEGTVLQGLEQQKQMAILRHSVKVHVARV